MTNDDKARNWCSEKLPCARYEALSTENERLREKLLEIIAYSEKHIDDTDAYVKSKHNVQEGHTALGDK